MEASKECRGSRNVLGPIGYRDIRQVEMWIMLLAGSGENMKVESPVKLIVESDKPPSPDHEPLPAPPVDIMAEPFTVPRYEKKTFVLFQVIRNWPLTNCR